LYDSEIGRFLGVDPLAGVFPGHSPYNYVMGNPISLVDQDGKMPSGTGPGDIPYPIRKAMGQLESQLTGLKNKAVSIKNKAVSALASVGDFMTDNPVTNFIVDKVVGNDDIGNQVTYAETASDLSSTNSPLKSLGGVAKTAGPILQAAEGAKILYNFDSNSKESKGDLAKFLVESGAGIFVPAASIPANILIRDARNGGITSPERTGEHVDALMSSWNNDQVANEHVRRANEAKKKEK
jgi:hypothetical protein